MFKLKLVNVCAVCLITLALIFPSITVFGWVWEKHIEYIEIQQNVSTYNQDINSNYSRLLVENDYLISDRDFSNLELVSNETSLDWSDNYQHHHLWRWVFLFVPLCIGIAVYFYDRYLVYRAHIFQQQVEMLEKLWQQSLEK